MFHTEYQYLTNSSYAIAQEVLISPEIIKKISLNLCNGFPRIYTQSHVQIKSCQHEGVEDHLKGKCNNGNFRLF